MHLILGIQTTKDLQVITTLLKNATIEWDREGLPHAREYADIYFSVNNPLEESRHVFLAGNNLSDRFPRVSDKTFLIGECGFGFGLNFLITVDDFTRLAPAGSRLHYISCELHPVRQKDLQRYYAKLPTSLLPLSAALLSHYPEQGKGLHRIQLSYRQRYITLDLVYEDASHAFSNISMPEPAVDAWYLDGFSPSRNEAMWQPRLFRELAAMSHAGTTLASYSVAGKVRRNLENAGFRIEKSPGFGNKRHMLSGHYEHVSQTGTSSWTNPWPKPTHQSGKIAVIGAGLAGCATAHALASRGVSVTLIEARTDIAEGSSGNPRGIVHLNPVRKLVPGARFRLQAFNFATRHYQLLSRNHETDWQPGGVIHLATTDKERQLQALLFNEGLYDPALLKKLTPAMAGKLAGPMLPEATGLLFPGGGSISPKKLCRAWASHLGITLTTNTRVDAATYTDNRWLLSLSGPEGNNAGSFDTVVICTNDGPAGFPDFPDYPCLANHGQTDTYQLDGPVWEEIQLPDAVISHKGYVVPWRENAKQWLMVGGSYAQGRHSREADDSLGKKNTALLRQMAPVLASLLENSNCVPASRCGTRITTPDYLPLVGPVEDTRACTGIFANLKRNARKPVSAQPQYLPGLFMNLAHGSSGLTTTPLLGEYLASLICGEPLPLPKDDILAIHPLRFLVRNLKKQQ